MSDSSSDSSTTTDAATYRDAPTTLLRFPLPECTHSQFRNYLEKTADMFHHLIFDYHQEKKACEDHGIPNGNRMMHYTKQHTKPNCSPWHFWMDITAHQLLWLRPSTTFNDELLSNLRSRTSRTYIHWWSKRTWNRFSLGFFTNMHIHFDNNVVLWSSLYKDWTSLQTPVIQEIHQMVKYNNTARPSRNQHHISMCTRVCRHVAFSITLCQPFTVRRFVTCNH